jgi:YbgC/YbaW family acyl-CoA thioester hydrolase
MTRGPEIRQSRIYLERFEIPFDDIDAGGVLYNAHYLKYCDRARNAIFAKANWTWDRMVANRCVLAVVSVEAEYRRAVRQGAVWIATQFSSDSDRLLFSSHAFLPGELTESDAQTQTLANKFPLEKMRGVHFRSKFKLIPVAVGDFVPGSLDSAFADAIFEK